MNAIRLEKVSKRFRRYSQPRRPTTLKSALVDLVRGRRGSEDGQFLWALKDIDLEVPQGTTLGVIGRNGSGKSTLLKILAGIYKPNSGKVEVNGRISALIELGAGFHPELSGRENIFINGMILGLSRREIRQKFDEIVAFAELEDFIDAPVRTYSSGMYARLGFSVAIHVNPDILLIDEVLSVGDQLFQNNCLKKISDFMKKHKTIVFVSHSLGTVKQICDRTICLSEGEMVKDDRTEETVFYYISRISNKDTKLEKHREDTKCTIGPCRLMDLSFQEADSFQTHSSISIEISCIPKGIVHNPVFGITIWRSDGVEVSGFNSGTDRFVFPPFQDPMIVKLIIENLPLQYGIYHVSVGLRDGNEYCDYHEKACSFSVPFAEKQTYGLVYMKSRWEFYPSAVPA